jgi:putative endonuclease
LFFVYVISSTIRDYVYVGLTDNPNRRINQHNLGYEKTTKPYRPFITLFIESFQTRLEARKREIYLKSASGKRWIKKNWLCGPV